MGNEGLKVIIRGMDGSRDSLFGGTDPVLQGQSNQVWLHSLLSEIKVSGGDGREGCFLCSGS